jgi:salicylate hydroxylase
VSKPILVAGAGIGGLAAALALARRGFDVRVFERASALSEVGAGLQLSPNAARILRGLGVDAFLDPALGRPEALVVHGASGKVLVEMPLGDAAEQRWGAPSWVAHRADLQAALFDAVSVAPNVVVTLGARATDCTETDDAVSLHVTSDDDAPSNESGALLVAADGVHSSLRRKLLGDGPPTYTGLTAFRAVVPVDAVPGALRRNVTGLWMGPGAHLVHYPLRGGALVNIVAIALDPRPNETALDASAGRDEVARHFAGFGDSARALIGVPESYRRWPLYDRPPEERWPDGRIALLGDAAHPMPPFLAQGAAMSIEDAAVLARCLGEVPVAEALARYRAERLPRVARVQREAARNSLVFHLSGPFALARDMALRLMGADGFAARYDWLYGWHHDRPAD